MAIILEEFKILLLQTPGTGSTALENALLSTPFAKSCAEKHSSFLEVSKFTGIYFDSSWEIVSSVRNPFDWYVSEWMRLRKIYVWELFDEESFYFRDLLKRKEIIAACGYDFSDWINFILIVLYEMDKKNKKCIFHRWTEGATQIFKYEDSGAIGLHFEEKIGTSLGLEKINKGPDRNPYWQFYSEHARHIVSDICSVTLDSYKYIF